VRETRQIKSELAFTHLGSRLFSLFSGFLPFSATRSLRHAIGVTPGMPGMEIECMSVKQTGTVISWFRERGFGFIQIANGKNHFAHIHEWMSDDEPAVGQTVIFESVPAAQGPKAINIYLESDIESGANALGAGV
jgi:cold shock CspA family protein